MDPSLTLGARKDAGEAAGCAPDDAAPAEPADGIEHPEAAAAEHSEALEHAEATEHPEPAAAEHAESPDVPSPERERGVTPPEASEAQPHPEDPEDPEDPEAHEAPEAAGGELENSLFPRSDSGRLPAAEDDELVQHTPRLADEFEERGVLGRGGMGVVLLARERSSGREVALKRLQRGVDRGRVLSEARTVASLDHPGIVRLDRVVSTDAGEVVLVLERVEGSDLEALVDREGTPGVLEALELCRGVAAALAYAHAHGVVHRDVKPANVLVAREGRARLTDFGLALHPDLQSLLDTGWCGTVDYMAPEQRTAADRVDGRADVYGLGATLYRLLTGTSPRVIREGRLPEATRELVLRCVEEAPADRFPSMDALLEELDRVIDRLRQDQSGVRAPLERIAEDFQRSLDRSSRAARIERLSVAASGLARMGLLPADTPRRLAVRLDMGEPWDDELERLVGLVLDAAHPRAGESPGLLADAHALLTTALRGVELSDTARRLLRRLGRASRTSARPELAVRLTDALRRFVAQGSLSREALETLAPAAAAEEPAAVLDRVLEHLRAAATGADEASWPAHEASWRHALRDLAAVLPEADLASRIRQGQLALELESLRRQEGADGEE